MRVDLDVAPAELDAARWLQQRNLSIAPRLPTVSRDRQRRWSGAATWTPAGSLLLSRHRSVETGECVFTTDGTPPPGYALEFHLGLVHVHAELGTRRLLSTPEGFSTTRAEGRLADDCSFLGYVEQAPLPLLDALEVRVDPVSEQPVLVAGAADPLFETAAPLGTLGFVESYPINPRSAAGGPAEWRIATLVRRPHRTQWRHSYEVTAAPGAEDVALGGVVLNGGRAMVQLVLHASGELSTELVPLGATRPDVRALARWSLAPLGWTEGQPRAWAARAALGRGRALASRQARVRGIGARSGGATIGYLRREPAPGWSPLYCARHPALADQYVTRSELEAADLGYEIDGVLGYAIDRLAARSIENLPQEVKWGSRFGQRRRYVEGPMPGAERG